MYGILESLDFRSLFQKSIFEILGVKIPRFLKNRGSHLVELVILRLLVFSICIFIENCVFHRPAKFAQFWTKSGV